MTNGVINLRDGNTMTYEAWTTDERATFDADFDKLVYMASRTAIPQMFTNQAQRMALARQVSELFYAVKEEIAGIGQACKKDIQPAAGSFNGINATSDYGMQLIRPDFLVPTAQGRTFDVTLATTKDTWYGLYQNGAIGAAVSTTQLYLRKELGIALFGIMELQTPCMDEFQFWINNKEQPIVNALAQFRAGDPPIALMPTVYYLRPAKQYRSSFKANVAAGNFCPFPLGVAFVSADYMRTQQPTQPATTAP